MYVAVNLQGIAFAVSGKTKWAKAIRLDAAAHKIYQQIEVQIENAAKFWDEFMDIYIGGAKNQVGEDLARK